LTVHLRDISRSIDVALSDSIDPQTGILARSAEIANNTPLPVTIVQAEGATWNLPRSTNYVLRYLAGRW
jgi:alpha-galactosidase